MAKIKARGVVIKYGAAATPTTNMSQVAEISYEGGNWDRVDTTTLDSAGNTKTYDTTVKEPPSLDVKVMLDPAGVDHEFIRANHASGALVYLTLVLPDTGTAQFALSGHITNYSIGGITMGGMLEMSFTFNAAGVETFTA